MSTSTTNDALHLAELAASGIFTPEVCRWVQAYTGDFLRHAGAVALGRCARLPAKSVGLAKAKRNASLRLAGQCLTDTPPGWERSKALHREIEIFRDRIWPCWSNLSQPPAYASNLRIELFHAFRSGAYIPKTARQIDNIING